MPAIKLFKISPYNIDLYVFFDKHQIKQAG